MTPQENDLVNALFDRLANLENTPRDSAAEQQIAEGLRRAPHAVYALVQTALVQDEALKRANARIEALQAQAGNAQEAPAKPAGFLDAMREALAGHAPPRSSVPSVRPAAAAGSQPPPLPPGYQGTQPGYPPPGYTSATPFSSGGSFLGTAASAAAGMVGGALLLDGIRSMFGHSGGGYGAGGFAAGPAFGGFGGERSLPWSDPTAANNGDSDLARDLGADQIGNRQDAGQQGDATSFTDDNADTQEVSDADDQYDAGGDDYDTGDSGGDSYDV